MKTIITNVEFADFDDDKETVSVTAATENNVETFHVQTTDGEYRSSMGCWIFTDDDGSDLDPDNYPGFNFDEIERAAEKFMEPHVSGVKNPAYLNKQSSPYTRRFL